MLRQLKLLCQILLVAVVSACASQPQWERRPYSVFDMLLVPADISSEYRPRLLPVKLSSWGENAQATWDSPDGYGLIVEEIWRHATVADAKAAYDDYGIGTGSVTVFDWGVLAPKADQHKFVIKYYPDRFLCWYKAVYSDYFVVFSVSDALTGTMTVTDCNRLVKKVDSIVGRFAGGKQR